MGCTMYWSNMYLHLVYLGKKSRKLFRILVKFLHLAGAAADVLVQEIQLLFELIHPVCSNNKVYYGTTRLHWNLSLIN